MTLITFQAGKPVIRDNKIGFVLIHYTFTVA
jgi:hypothetical protein